MTEVVADHCDIQGIVRGFGVDYAHAIFAFFVFRDAPSGRSALHKLRAVTTIGDLDPKTAPADGINVALSFDGLRALGLPFGSLESFPEEFRQGMAARALDNGDTGASDPEHWDRYWRDPDGVHLLVAVYGQTSTDARHRYVAVRSKLRGLTRFVGRQVAAHLFIGGCDNLPSQTSSTDPPSKSASRQVREHFGFVDGVSDVPIQGLSRHSSGGRINDRGHWRALAAGEFLMGYVDEAGEMPAAPSRRGLAHNGTFLVYRKLYQDVPTFRLYLQQQAQRLLVTEERLAEKMVGRKRDGRPLVVPADDLGGFRYASDRQGRQCPFGAHARRANPRDQFGEDTALVDRHRILRRGMTYGPYLQEGDGYSPGAPPVDRGLVFIALNVSIDRQFEFIQRQWINTGTSLDQGNDPDPLVGTRRSNTGKFVVPGDDEHPTLICAELPDFVKTRGGGYFFLPGVRALHGLASGRFDTDVF